MKKEDFMKVVRSKHSDALSAEQEAFYGNIGELLETAMSAETVERNKQLSAITDKLGGVDEGQTISAIVRTLGTKIDELESKFKRGLSDGEKYSLRRMLEGKKDDIYAVMNSKDKGKAWEIEFKARRAVSDMMQTTTILTGAVAINTDNVFDDMELTVIRYPANFVPDAINSRPVSKVPYSIKWKEQITAGTGAVAAIGEGVEKPLVDFKFEWKYAYRKKYAGRIEFTEETEIDFEQLVLDVIQMFEDQVLRAYNDGLLVDILAWAPSYVSSALDGTIVKPTVMNVVNAGRLAIAVQNYTADTLIINPADYAATQNMQNINGDPIFVPDNVLFPGLRLFITNKITAGTALVGEGGIIKEQHGSFILRSGQYGNQLIENEKTIIGELFSVLKLPTESKKGWMQLDIAAVKLALTLIPVLA
jgi:hypothetical protein